MVNTKAKGDSLEDKFYEYLLSQKRQGELVFGLYPAHLCEIHKKKKYYCKIREADIEFDVVVELSHEGISSPHFAAVFECKNHSAPVQERDINDFSAKLDRIFKHANKGVIVTASRLQSGAEKVAKNYKMGVVKYDENGLEFVAHRKGRAWAENRFIQSQLFDRQAAAKSLKFSAYDDGKFFGSIEQLMRNIDPVLSTAGTNETNQTTQSIPYLADREIKQSVQLLLEQVGYEEGIVDLEKICSVLSIDLQRSEEAVQDVYGKFVLGSANFNRRTIVINLHENQRRERFTIAHEIGHFCLSHDRYLRSENIVEADLLIDSEKEINFNYDRLEFQANAFASELLLPEQIFVRKTNEYRQELQIRDRGHGYIFVDSQRCNYMPYDMLLAELSSYFDVSKQAIEIKLSKLNMLTDQRNLDSVHAKPRFTGIPTA